jgi:lipopolysaccharide export LptBFGC system permease protein LptF
MNYTILLIRERRGLKTSTSIWSFYIRNLVCLFRLFILTIIAVSVSSMKRRGGMGMNLTIGIALAFLCIFDKIFGVLAENLVFPLIVVCSLILFSESSHIFTAECKR